jgi:predicted GTPase
MKRVLILGAAGRDFHNFNALFRLYVRMALLTMLLDKEPSTGGTWW